MKKFLFILTLIGLLLAHPHTFIKSRLGVEFNKKEVKGVWVNWSFDEMFSAGVIAEADQNGDGKFDKDETDYLYNNAFINLENYNYFFFVRKGTEREGAQKVTNFSAFQKNNILYYKFFIPLKTQNNPVIISQIDPTFFCAVDYYKDKPIYFVNDQNIKTTFKRVKNQNFPVYYNPMGAIDDTTLYTKWEKGLITAYPEEIIITYK